MCETDPKPLPIVDLGKTPYDQSTYFNRLKHFIRLTNPFLLLTTGRQLNRAKKILDDYQNGRELPPDVKSMKDIWRAKYQYDSAFHPETGEKMILIGRMSAQFPMNWLITLGMLFFYKSSLSVSFWQFFNQSFNAVVNYTNRSASSSITERQIFASYLCAASGSVLAANIMRHMLIKTRLFSLRYVPMITIIGANFINLPIMRSNEIMNGIKLLNENNEVVGLSRKAGVIGITKVCCSRAYMAAYGLISVPITHEFLLGKPFFHRRPQLIMPFQLLLAGLMLAIATPTGCALFPQWSTISVEKLEKEVREQILKNHPDVKVLHYNKGL